MGFGWPSRVHICFVVLLILYAFLMNKLDEKHGFGEED